MNKRLLFPDSTLDRRSVWIHETSWSSGWTTDKNIQMTSGAFLLWAEVLSTRNMKTWGAQDRKSSKQKASLLLKTTRKSRPRLLEGALSHQDLNMLFKLELRSQKEKVAVLCHKQSLKMKDFIMFLFTHRGSCTLYIWTLSTWSFKGVAVFLS